MAKKKKSKKKASSSGQIRSLQNQINQLKSQNDSLRSQNQSYSNELKNAYDYDEAQKAINEYNTESAARQMQFQDYMSSTAHQREVTDLVAAGLNPILSSNQGAASGMGAYAVSDNSATTSKFAERQLKLQLANSSAMNQANIIAQRAMNKYNTDKQYKLGLQQARISASATKAAAGAAAAASMYAANQAAAASRYGSDKQYEAQIAGQANSAKIAFMNNATSMANKQKDIDYNTWQKQWDTKYPQTYAGIVSSTMYGLENGFGLFGN